MENFSKKSSHAFYPQPTNHIVNDPTPLNQAVYVPSVTPSYAMQVYAKNYPQRLPHGVKAGALNFLDPANRDFFHISHVMSSAGQALNQKKSCIITERDRASTVLICDSGGYQIAHNSKKIDGVRDRARILAWMEENADYAMTLDVPTGPLLKPGYRYGSFKDCLDETLDHLTFFRDAPKSGRVKYLNVLQGNTPDQADAWYDAVKQFDFEGWAFAGKLRNNIPELLRRIVIMINEGQIQDKKWIHVLGTCDLETAVLLTAIQRSINNHVNEDLRISFDTSSPFLMLKINQVYAIPTLEPSKMSMPTRDTPNQFEFVGKDVSWPWPSPLGNLMKVSDICVDRPVYTNGYHDALSYLLLAHHNLSALCWGIALANRIFDAEGIGAAHTIGISVGGAIESIDRVIEKASIVELRKRSSTLGRLKHSKEYEADNNYDTGEDQREALQW